MSKEITKKDPFQASLEVRGIDQRQFRVIKEILYPNVQKDETLLMAIDYCKARKLDIMKRTIQIVPIWDSKTKSMKDTIWPSIAEIRITATRTGQYAGRSEAEFGDEITEKLSGVEVTYPKWCRVTVYRIVAGNKCQFTAKLFWKQEYKTAKNDTSAPNSMWSKRSYSQLEKCTEAAALRMAFPEEIGNDFIAEEAFDSNEAMVNVTPSKTAAAHAPLTPPPAIDQSFQEPRQIDLEELVTEVSDCESSGLNTNFLNQDPKEIFEEISNNISIITTVKGVNSYMARIADKMAFLDDKAPDLKIEILSLVSQRLEEVENDR